MFDKVVIESLDLMLRREVEDALVILADSGIIEKQKEQLLARLASTADLDSPEELATKVAKYRKDIRALDSLKQQGDQLQKEREHATEE